MLIPEHKETLMTFTKHNATNLKHRNIFCSCRRATFFCFRDYNYSKITDAER
jgi:hypothetical protein